MTKKKIEIEDPIFTSIFHHPDIEPFLLDTIFNDAPIASVFLEHQTTGYVISFSKVKESDDDKQTLIQNYMKNGNFLNNQKLFVRNPFVFENLVLYIEPTDFDILDVNVVNSNVDEFGKCLHEIVFSFYAATHKTEEYEGFQNDTLSYEIMVKDLIEGIAHDIANPLSIIKANHQVGSNYLTKLNKTVEKDQAKTKELMDQITSIYAIEEEAIDKISVILNELRTFIGHESTQPNLSTYDLHELIIQGINLVRLRSKHEIYFEPEFAQNILVSKTHVIQSVFHLLNFIINDMNENKPITICTLQPTLDNPYNVKISAEKAIDIQSTNYSYALAKHLVSQCHGHLELVPYNGFVEVLVFLPPIN